LSPDCVFDAQRAHLATRFARRQRRFIRRRIALAMLRRSRFGSDQCALTTRSFLGRCEPLAGPLSREDVMRSLREEKVPKLRISEVMNGALHSYYALRVFSGGFRSNQIEELDFGRSVQGSQS
jgi:hypothetical protein